MFYLNVPLCTFPVFMALVNHPILNSCCCVLPTSGISLSSLFFLFALPSLFLWTCITISADSKLHQWLFMTLCWQHNSQVCSFFPPGSRYQRKYSFLTPNIYLYWLHYHFGTRERMWLLLHLPYFPAYKLVWVLLSLPYFFLPLYSLQNPISGFQSQPPLNCFPASFKEASNKGRKNRNGIMDAKLLSFKASAHAFLYLDELDMFLKLKLFKVLLRKMSGLQKWKEHLSKISGNY